MQALKAAHHRTASPFGVLFCFFSCVATVAASHKDAHIAYCWLATAQMQDSDNHENFVHLPSHSTVKLVTSCDSLKSSQSGDLRQLGQENLYLSRLIVKKVQALTKRWRCRPEASSFCDLASPGSLPVTIECDGTSCRLCAYRPVAFHSRPEHLQPLSDLARNRSSGLTLTLSTSIHTEHGVLKKGRKVKPDQT